MGMFVQNELDLYVHTEESLVYQTIDDWKRPFEED